MSATTDALGVAVDVENAAIYVYGVTTAFASDRQRPTIDEYIAAHRSRRDALNQALVAAQSDQRQPAPGYTMRTVTDPAGVAQAANAAEVDCTLAYRALIEKADSEAVRRLGVEGLTDCALRVAHWHQDLGIPPTTAAFPGGYD